MIERQMDSVDAGLQVLGNWSRDAPFPAYVAPQKKNTVVYIYAQAQYLVVSLYEQSTVLLSIGISLFVRAQTSLLL